MGNYLGIPTADQEALQKPAVDPIDLIAGALSGAMLKPAASAAVSAVPRGVTRLLGPRDLAGIGAGSRGPSLTHINEMLRAILPATRGQQIADDAARYSMQIDSELMRRAFDYLGHKPMAKLAGSLGDKLEYTDIESPLYKQLTEQHAFLKRLITDWYGPGWDQ